jgi:hypothetical protein
MPSCKGVATRYQRPVEVAAAEAEPRVVAFVADRPLERHFVNSGTLAEIGFGIELVAEPNRRAELNEWLTHKVRPMFEPRFARQRACRVRAQNVASLKMGCSQGSNNKVVGTSGGWRK